MQTEVCGISWAMVRACIEEVVRWGVYLACAVSCLWSHAHERYRVYVYAHLKYLCAHSFIARCDAFSKSHPPFQNPEGCSCNIDCAGDASGQVLLICNSLKYSASGFYKIFELLNKLSKPWLLFCACMPQLKAFFNYKPCCRDILDIVSNIDNILTVSRPSGRTVLI